MTSPIVSGASPIATGDDEMEPSDQNLVSWLETHPVHTITVDVGPVGRAGVLDHQFCIAGYKAAVMTRNGDVVEKDITLGMPPDGCGTGGQDEGHSSPGPPLHDQSESLDTREVGCLLRSETRMIRQWKEDHGGIGLDMRAAFGALVGPGGDDGVTGRTVHSSE